MWPQSFWPASFWPASFWPKTGKTPTPFTVCPLTVPCSYVPAATFACSYVLTVSIPSSYTPTITVPGASCMTITSTLNQPVYCGEDKGVNGPIFQGDGVTPQNITGWTIRGSVVNLQNFADVLTVDNGSVGGLTVTNVTVGNVYFLMPHALTSVWNPGMYAVVFRRIDSGYDNVIGVGNFQLVKASVQT